MSSQIPKRIVPTPARKITANSSPKITATRATHTEIAAEDGGQVSKMRMAAIVGGHAAGVNPRRDVDSAQSGENRASKTAASETRNPAVQRERAGCLRATDTMGARLPTFRRSVPLALATAFAPGQSGSLRASSSSLPLTCIGVGLPSKCRVMTVCS